MSGRIDELVVAAFFEYLVFAILCLFILANIVAKMLLQVWRKHFPEKYEYGICNGHPARRSVKCGNVQFALWKAGEQGHTSDCWHDFDSSWWPQFLALTSNCALGNIADQYHPSTN